jgi:hypothetical protein
LGLEELSIAIRGNRSILISKDSKPAVALQATCRTATTSSTSLAMCNVKHLLLLVALVTLLPACNCAKLDVQASKVVEQVLQTGLYPGHTVQMN